MSFAVIYRWTVAPEHEDYFRRRWHDGTLRYRELGGLGSLLARDEGGAFVAIALWHSAADRERAFAARGPGEPWPGILSFEETKLEVLDDLWLSSAFKTAGARS
jgi:hypothetical protein